MKMTLRRLIAISGIVVTLASVAFLVLVWRYPTVPQSLDVFRLYPYLKSPEAEYVFGPPTVVAGSHHYWLFDDGVAAFQFKKGDEDRILAPMNRIKAVWLISRLKLGLEVGEFDWDKSREIRKGIEDALRFRP